MYTRTNGKRKICLRLLATSILLLSVLTLMPWSFGADHNVAHAADELMDTELVVMGGAPLDDGTIIDMDELGGDPEVRCLVPGSFDCMASCAKIKAFCPQFVMHPYKATPDPGALYWCKGGWLSHTCSYKFTNGDNCTRIHPLMKWYCLYDGGKKSVSDG